MKLELTNRLRVKTNVLMLLLDIILLELRTLQHQVTTMLHHKYLVKQERTALKIQLLIAAYPEQAHVLKHNLDTIPQVQLEERMLVAQ